VPRDTQIFSGAAHDGNADYLLPGNSEIEVLAVSAAFSDNGAGSDWCPAVVMISDSGHTIARALLPDVKVTAGDDAEVSWFPGVKPGGSSTTSASIVYSRGYTDSALGDSVIVVPAHGQILAPMAHIDADASGAITWTTSVNPNDTATLQGPGLFMLQTSVHFQTSGAGEAAFVYIGANGEWPTESWGGASILDNPAGTNDPLGRPTNLSYALVRVLGSGSKSVALMLEQNTAVNLNVTQAYMSIIGFPGV
jgi:hypothetical protein